MKKSLLRKLLLMWHAKQLKAIQRVKRRQAKEKKKDISKQKTLTGEVRF